MSDTETGACGHELGEKVVTGADGTVYCCVFCHARARPAIELKLLLARADVMEAEQAQLRKMNGRALGAAMLNGKKS